MTGVALWQGLGTYVARRQGLPSVFVVLDAQLMVPGGVETIQEAALQALAERRRPWA